MSWCAPPGDALGAGAGKDVFHNETFCLGSRIDEKDFKGEPYHTIS